MDPLRQLPAEIVLRIIDFAAPKEVAQLTRLTKSWHQFIDETHQDAIYSATSKVNRPPECRDYSFLEPSQSFAKLFEGVGGWKDVCKRQQLLKKNWSSKQPITKETVLQIGSTPVWRFRPDFKRRIILSTSQSGGVNVTDMDNGRLLWHKPTDEVRPYAHLEYGDGIACWDRWGSSIEVWKHDENQRGTFHRIAVLPHDCETRGFQINFNTLCVASSEGQGFVYDLSVDPPTLKTHLEIENGAAGHLYQCEDAVAYSVGVKGYYFYAKESGEYMGCLQPNNSTNIYHIRHPPPRPNSDIARMNHGRSNHIFPPRRRSKNRLVPLNLESGPHPHREDPVELVEDEWGAGMMVDNFMVGVSRGGRTFICSDWRGSLASQERAIATSAIVETESEGTSFDLGGWLSIHNGRILFEVNDRIYIFTLNADGLLPVIGEKQAPVWAVTTSSAPQLTVPVSFMAVYDDCLMSTYTTLGFHGTENDDDDETADRPRRHSPRPFATKAIRIISLAPELEDNVPKLWVKGDDEAEGPNFGVPGQTSARSVRSELENTLSLAAFLVGDDEEGLDSDGHEGA